MALSNTACFVVFLAILQLGSCINCYQCNTQNDTSCTELSPGTRTVDCSSPESLNYNQMFLNTILPPEVFRSVPGASKFCYKIITVSGNTIRTCLDGSLQDLLHTCHVVIFSSFKRIKSCYVCATDNCNA